MNRNTPQKSGNQQVQNGDPDSGLINRKSRDVLSWIEKNKNDMERLVGSDISERRVKSLCLEAFDKQEKLRNCSTTSIIQSLLKVIRYNLQIGSECYLIPKGGECEFEFDYKGLIRLAERTDGIHKVQCDVVGENCEFYYNRGPSGLDWGHEKHTWDFDSLEDIKLAYAVAYGKDGNGNQETLDIEVVGPNHLKKARAMSGNPWDEGWSDVWDEWPSRMARKTPVRSMLGRFEKSRDVSDGLDEDRPDEYPSSSEKDIHKLNQKFESDESSGGDMQDAVAAEFEEVETEPEPEQTPEPQKMLPGEILENTDLDDEGVNAMLDFVAFNQFEDKWSNITAGQRRGLAEDLLGKNPKKSLPARVIPGVSQLRVEKVGEQGELECSFTWENALEQVKKHHSHLLEYLNE